jgi:hypothetical protein
VNRIEDARKGLKPLRSIMQASGKKRITSIFLYCGVALGVLACLSAPVNPVPGSRPASRQSSPTSTDGTTATIDPTVISIGDREAGDNWPSTWANDDNIYTYLSDGTGFGFSSA